MLADPFKTNNMTQQTAVMQLIKFILIERRQEDGSIKFHAHEDFSRFLQMEKEQIIEAFDIACEDEDRIGKEYYNETYQNK